MSKPVQIVIIVVCLAAAGYLIFNSATKEGVQSEPKTYYFQCANTACEAEWEWVAGGPLPPGTDDYMTCATCSTDMALECAKCMECGKLHPVVGHGGSQRECPHCGANMLEQQEAG